MPVSVQYSSGVSGYDLLAAARRKQILQLMGIDVWVQRRAQQATAEKQQSIDVQGRQPPAAERPEQSVAAELMRDLRQAERSQSMQPSPSDSRTPAVSPGRSPETNAFPACRILAVRQKDVLVLTEMTQQTLTRRLGRDVVASTTREWDKRPTETLFDWQPGQIAGVSVDGRRALSAFVSRQLDELSAGSLMIAEALVIERLPELVDLAAGRNVMLTRVIRLPQLVDDVVAKRNLWSQLQQVRA